MLIDENDDDSSPCSPCFEFPGYLLCLCVGSQPRRSGTGVLVDGKPADHRDEHSGGSQEGDKVLDCEVVWTVRECQPLISRTLCS